MVSGVQQQSTFTMSTATDGYTPVLRLPRGVRPWTLGLFVWLIPVMTTLMIASVGAQTTTDTAISYPAQKGADGQLHMTGDQCASCHKVDAGFSHPVGKIPSMQVPAGLPLEGGKVTCITCHDDSLAAHSSTITGSLLRMPSEGGILCTACHTDSGRTRQGMHPMGTERAHLSWTKQGTDGGTVVLLSSQRLAPLTTTTATSNRFAIAGDEDGTRSCLSCHDGTVASDAFSNDMQRMVGSSGAGHPSGIPYSNARTGMKQADGYLQPVESLDPRVRLFNGQVGCQSCHSVYSTETKLLVKSNRDSALCITCHDMR